MTTFANRIKELRKEHGWSQDVLAEKLGMSRSAVGNYETGIREPDFETLETIADVFNVDMDYLTGRTDDTTNLSGLITQAYIKGQQVSAIANNPKVLECASKILELPPEMQSEAFNYVDYLMNRHLLSQAQTQGD